MKLLTVLLTLTSALLVEGQVSMHNPFYCYTSDPIRPQYAMHAKQSNYEAILRRGFNPNVSTCTPTGFWYLSRHGGCLPKVGTIEDMNSIGIGPIQANIMRNFHSGRATLCHTDFHQIRDWKPDPNITLDNAGALTGPGRILTHSLAQRYQEAFPTVLRRPYNRAQFTFRHTDRARSESTARVFADGLFGLSANENVEFEDVPQVDTFLRPNSFCPNFTSLFSNVETEAFMDGPEFREMVSQVNSKLGFTGSDQLSVQKLLTLWDVCRYEKSFEDEGRTSAWCGPFSIANNEVLEYLQDLRYYYMFGYGVPNRRIVENLNCGLMQNLLNFLSSDEATSEAARVFVTSSSNLEAFFVSLGLFEDEQHLTRHNMAQQMNRKWRTSWMAPKGANLAVIRYDCAEDNNDVLFLFNERPLQIPGCQVNGLCKESFIMDRFSRFIGTDCSNIFCKIDCSN